jgi:hypothetical protein
MRCHPQPYHQQLEAEQVHQILLRQATLSVSKWVPFIFSDGNLTHIIHLAICLCHFEIIIKLMQE